MIVSIDLLRLKEKILSFAQELSKYLLNPYELFSEVSHAQ